MFQMLHHRLKDSPVAVLAIMLLQLISNDDFANLLIKLNNSRLITEIPEPESITMSVS